jgi:hypothetical protein
MPVIDCATAIVLLDFILSKWLCYKIKNIEM